MAIAAKRLKKSKRQKRKSASVRQRKSSTSHLQEIQLLPSRNLHKINAARQMARALDSSTQTARVPTAESVIGVPFVIVFHGSKPVRILNVPNIMNMPDGRLGVSIKKQVYPILRTDEYCWIDQSAESTKKSKCVKILNATNVATTNSITLAPALEAAELLEILTEESDRKFISKHLSNKKRLSQKQRSTPKLTEMLAKLGERTPQQLVGMWRNAINALSGEHKLGLGVHEITTMINAIEEEWEKRAIAPIASDDYFKWPTTDAPKSSSRLATFEAQGEGILSYLEYRVGKTNGLPTKVRRAILERVFIGKLPPVFSRAYMEAWGTPKSTRRLQKAAECIAAFARNAKRRDDDRFEQAIQEWESDLEWLYNRYYVDQFQFAWPSLRTTP